MTFLLNNYIVLLPVLKTLSPADLPPNGLCPEKWSTVSLLMMLAL
jgi:hypothetical protein